jgi:sigma-B regulation protein RsbU (phosphoserine phosphatase)
MLKKIFRNKGFAFKLSVYILTSASLVLAAIILFNFFVTRNIILKEVENNARNISFYNVSRIENVLDGVEKVTNEAANILESSNFNVEEINDLLKFYIQQSDEIYGGTIAFEQGIYNTKIQKYSPYYSKHQDSLTYVNIADVSDYKKLDWYTIPFNQKMPVWSEPYFDEGVSDIIMTTYSVPFYKNMNGERIPAGIVTADVSLEWLEKIVSSVEMFESGFAFIVSNKGTFVTYPNKEFILNESLFSLAEKNKSNKLKAFGDSMISGKTDFVGGKSMLLQEAAWMFYTQMPSSKWTFAVIFPEDELYADVNYMNTIILVIGLIGFILLLIIIIVVTRKLTKPLESLSLAAEQIGTGKLDTILPLIKSNDEVGRLTSSMNYMQEQLKEYIENLKTTTTAKEKIESELRIAQQIQLGMIPKLFPPYPDIPQIDLFAKMIPAREVGGDLYDFFFIDKTHLCIAIGDVSGKGVPASLLMAVSRTLLHAKAVPGITSAEITSQMDKDLQASKDSWMFVTFFLSIIDLTTGEMDYTNAGHNPPYLIRSDNSVVKLEVNKGLPLGLDFEKEYQAKKIAFKPGDKLILYTDGVTEAMNTKDELFDESGIEKVLDNNGNADVKELVESIFHSVDEFAGEAEQADDITTVAFDFKDKLSD